MGNSGNQAADGDWRQLCTTNVKIMKRKHFAKYIASDDPNFRVGEQGYTLLMMYLMCAQPIDLNAVNAILDRPGTDIDLKDNHQGYTALFYAAQFQAPYEVFKTIVYRGADVKLRSKNGFNVMKIHVYRNKYRDTKIAKLLIRAGFELKHLNQQDFGQLMKECMTDDKLCVLMLRDNKQKIK